MHHMKDHIGIKHIESVILHRKVACTSNNRCLLLAFVQSKSSQVAVLAAQEKVDVLKETVQLAELEPRSLDTHSNGDLFADILTLWSGIAFLRNQSFA